jgi:hypothetical protein
VAQWHAAGEKHDAAAIGGVDAKEWSAWLAEAAEFGGVHVEGAGGPGLVDGDVDGADAGIIHVDMGDEVAACIDDGDVHRAVDGPGFGLDGFNETPGGFEISDLWVMSPSGVGTTTNPPETTRRKLALLT